MVLQDRAAIAAAGFPARAHMLGEARHIWRCSDVLVPFSILWLAGAWSFVRVGCDELNKLASGDLE